MRLPGRSESASYWRSRGVAANFRAFQVDRRRSYRLRGGAAPAPPPAPTYQQPAGPSRSQSRFTLEARRRSVVHDRRASRHPSSLKLFSDDGRDVVDSGRARSVTTTYIDTPSGRLLSKIVASCAERSPSSAPNAAAGWHLSKCR